MGRRKLAVASLSTVSDGPLLRRSALWLVQKRRISPPSLSGHAVQRRERDSPPTREAQNRPANVRHAGNTHDITGSRSAARETDCSIVVTFACRTAHRVHTSPNLLRPWHRRSVFSVLSRAQSGNTVHKTSQLKQETQTQLRISHGQNVREGDRIRRATLII